jgi:hypothetical protein
LRPGPAKIDRAKEVAVPNEALAAPSRGPDGPGFHGGLWPGSQAILAIVTSLPRGCYEAGFCIKFIIMAEFIWKNLNLQQVGAYAEYFVKMEFTMHGFQVFSPEVDDRGIDFIARFGKGSWLEIQVKSVREAKYIFLTKEKFCLSPMAYAAIVILTEGHKPALYLISSEEWKRPNDLLRDRDYKAEGQTSAPEWGINLSKKNKPLLDKYRFDRIIQSLNQG